MVPSRKEALADATRLLRKCRNGAETAGERLYLALIWDCVQWASKSRQSRTARLLSLRPQGIAQLRLEGQKSKRVLFLKSNQLILKEIVQQKRQLRCPSCPHGDLGCRVKTRPEPGACSSDLMPFDLKFALTALLIRGPVLGDRRTVFIHCG